MFQRGWRKSVSRRFWRRPELIVNPADTAPALVALEATLRVIGPRLNARFQHRVLRPAARRRPTRKRLRERRNPGAHIVAASEAEFAQHLSQDSRPRSLDPCRGGCRDRSRDGWRDLEECPYRVGRSRTHPVSAGESGDDAGQPSGSRRNRAGEAAVEGANPLAKNA